MRRSRRGFSSGGHEFGGSGEDSFVAVVVTKLTGALLFILLLTMVIMALVPKADDDAPKVARKADESPVQLRIASPPTLPEAIAGHPYAVALAAEGASGPVEWRMSGSLPEGLTLNAKSGVIEGTPKTGKGSSNAFVVQVDDGSHQASATLQLPVYQPDALLSLPQRIAPSLPAIAWRSWMEQGFGFLVLLLVYFVGMSVVGGLERLAARSSDTRRFGRFFLYRMVLRLASVSAALILAIWIWRGRMG